MKQNVSFVFNVGPLLIVLIYILYRTIEVDVTMIRFGVARSICLQQRIFSAPGANQGQLQGPLKEIHPVAKFQDKCSWIQWEKGQECESGAGTGNGTNCSNFTKKSCKELGLAETQSEDSYDSRIIGGTVVEKDAYPSFVRVAYMDDKVFKCGGVIIDQNWVLTANRCLVEPKIDFIVVSGRSNILEPEEGEQVRRSDRQVYLDYAPPGQFFTSTKDLALLHLEEPLVLDGKKAAAVTLPTGPVESGEVTIVGSGQTTGDQDEEPTKIKELKLPVLADEPCKEAIGKGFSKEFVCMRKDGENDASCYGDEGAPIYSIGEDNSQVLVATSVFTTGIRCGNKPPITTVGLETFYFVDWIKNVTSS